MRSEEDTGHLTSTLSVADLSEQELVARIQQRLPPAPEWVLVGIGDDAAVVEPERNRVEVLTVDALVEGVHFDRRFTPADAVGYRAVAVNVSDLAAMGAEPRAALLSLVLPRTMPIVDFDQLADGFARAAREHRLHVVGGNLTRSPGPLILDVTVTGTVKRRQALTRAGARAGDDVYVTGSIGAAAAGLRMLQSGDASATDAATPNAACISRYLHPAPRLRAGVLLARHRAASACVDLSDGLADGVHRISDASRVSMRIDADALPIERGARDWFTGRGMDPSIESITGGDDYELLLTVSPRHRGRLKSAARHFGVPVTRIGVCGTAAEPTILRRAAEGGWIDVPLPRGYTHFR